jgi:hypothetical protein
MKVKECNTYECRLEKKRETVILLYCIVVIQLLLLKLLLDSRDHEDSNCEIRRSNILDVGGERFYSPESRVVSCAQIYGISQQSVVCHVHLTARCCLESHSRASPFHSIPSHSIP